MNFEEWMAEVDRIVSTSLWISVHELPDMCFRDAYDSGTTPEEFTEEELGIGEDGDIDPDELMDLLFG